ncbi:hypothetical protein I6A60_39840 [Frankia sp. AgB1.9]|uniref:hypothetical protein n=1 Tax=unclassified Frankia TaxID=2632575 RepID=UPI00193362A0|nr:MULTISPECIES: hypothetical protein [unclassified Frankia]MBL7486746.1 hypothetical protein [Frankia sp. AgW1.1]MBL7553938.1 hypothetical protein [Frankia sp. AgB1.9]MBL7618073.1 hypothetical protein [Frankia sp. AgB1.8]
MTTATYTDLLYLAAGLQLLCAVAAVGRRQLGPSIRLLSAQGTALAAIPFVSGLYRHEGHLVGVALAVLALRAGVLPWLVSRLVPTTVRPAAQWTDSDRDTDGEPLPGHALGIGSATGPDTHAHDDPQETREPTPLVSTAASLLLTGALTVLAYAVSRPLVSLDPSPATRAAPAALAVILIGLLVLTTRRRAVSQVIGFLTLDNGIAALAFLLTSGVPLVVELGASLDLLLAVLVVAALTGRMRMKFGGTDLGELQELHE